jgi:hypothetical protein
MIIALISLFGLQLFFLFQIAYAPEGAESDDGFRRVPPSLSSAQHGRNR